MAIISRTSLAHRLSRLLFRMARERGDYEPAPKRVLLAIDDVKLREQLAGALALDHHHAIELDDGLELLDYLAASDSDRTRRLRQANVIIATLDMAGMSGLAMLEALHERHDPTPFIGIANAGDARAFSRARELGAAFVFETPVQLDDVRAALFSLPGGVFPEAPLSRDARVAALRRGTHFLKTGSAASS